LSVGFAGSEDGLAAALAEAVWGEAVDATSAFAEPPATGPGSEQASSVRQKSAEERGLRMVGAPSSERSG
jgi:hypothetical protein